MRLFKGCPEDGREDCKDCPLLKHCVKKKLKRKALRFFKIHKQAFIMIIITIAVAIGSVIIIDKALEASIEEALNQQKKINIDLSNSGDEIAESTEPITVSLGLTVTKEEKTKTATETAKDSNFEISNIDIKNMEKVVYAEARGEPYEGQVAVAAVILNRYEFYNRERSITELVTEPYQFANISNVSQEMLDEYPDCKKAVQDALNGNDPTEREFSEGARYFYAPDHISGYQKEIREGIHVLKIGNHCFHNEFNN